MAESKESFLDTLKSAIKTSGATAKARAAGDWFREKVKQASASARMRAVTPTQLLKREEEGSATLGKMLFYKYDPKFAKKLPYWDMYPLVFPFEKAKGGFYGLNLHYLPHTLRAQFLDQLYDRTTNNKFDESTRFKLTYDLLKGISGKPFYKACYKHYLSSHVRSSFAKFDSADWEIAIFLPI